MFESILTMIFCITMIIIAFRVKSILYVDEHNQSIQNELNTFNDNFEKLNQIEELSNFNIGSGHLYE